MDIDVLSFQWFRYIMPTGITYKRAHKTLECSVNRSDIYGLSKVGDDKYALTLAEELKTVFTLKAEEANSLIRRSRGYMGKVNGTEVQSGTKLEALVKKSAPSGTKKSNKVDLDVAPTENETRPTSTVREQHGKGTVKQSGAPVGFSVLNKAIDLQSLTHRRKGLIEPLQPTTVDLLKTARKNLGILAHAKLTESKIVLGESRDCSTSLLTFKAVGKLSRIFCILNRAQLVMINDGKALTADLVAQVITHEFAHYVYSNTIRNSDKERFLKKVAGLSIHKDQLNHRGYSYAWHDEHWACLAESMVHGKCARGIVSNLGWEIVAKYFVNNYYDPNTGDYLGDKTDWMGND